MPQNKRQLFDSKRQLTSTMAQALCHPARLDIIDLLNKHGFMLCGEITDQLPLVQATVSQHLVILMGANIIIREVNFEVVGYQLNTEGWNEAKNHIKRFFAEVG